MVIPISPSSLPTASISLPTVSPAPLSSKPLSSSGHAVVAKTLWNNIVQPVGMKDRYANLTDLSPPLACPDKVRLCLSQIDLWSLSSVVSLHSNDEELGWLCSLHDSSQQLMPFICEYRFLNKLRNCIPSVPIGIFFRTPYTSMCKKTYIMYSKLWATTMNQHKEGLTK